MTTHRYALRDDQWERIKNLLPGRRGSVGVTAKDNRLFVDAVLATGRAFPSEIDPNASGTAAKSTRGFGTGQRRECGCECLSREPAKPITNMPGLAPRLMTLPSSLTNLLRQVLLL
jgi:hypothetical protein